MAALSNFLTRILQVAGMAMCLVPATAVPLWAAGQTLPPTGDEILKAAKKRIKTISTAQLKAMLDKDRNLVVIDVRTNREIYSVGGMIGAPGTVVIPRGWIEYRIADQVTDKNQPIVVYCGTNQRSPLAADTLTRMGYTNVMNYAEGFFAWRKAGHPVTQPDAAPLSILYRKPQKVIDGVWSAIGATAPGTPDNSGHNNNLSFIVTSDGVLVVNAGANYLLAAALHDEIKKITKQRVKYVVLENGQGHAALGSNYWKEQGATIIAHKDTVHEIEQNADRLIEVATRRTRDKMFRTKVVLPDKTFDDKMIIEMGGERIELLNLGPAHSPGDIVVWLPKKSLVISGDMAFHERLLPLFEHTQTGEWIKSWDKFAALKAKYVIPGHGGPTNMAQVTKYTRDYLVYMRGEMKKLIDAGAGLQDAYKVDQSAYRHLDTFEFLARRNAGQVFRSMEFE